MDNMELTLTIEEEPQATLNLGVAEGATDEASARTAEAYAKGTRNGVPVEEGDPAYHNNAKYYRDSAAAIAAGDVIDDNAGAGDYNLTWSADKLTSQKADIEELEDGKADAIEVTDSTPASVMSFSDGGNGYPLSATFEIAPVQDLHGYSYPWVGGAGKNLFNKDSAGNVTGKYLVTSTGELANSSSGYDTSDYIAVTAGQTYTASGFSITGTTEVCFYDGSKVFVPGSGIASNNHTFTVPSGAVYLRFDYKHADLNVMQLELGSSATTYAPYENLCPITGWTAVRIGRAGANIYGADIANIKENYYLNQSGVETSGSAWNYSRYYFPIFDNVQYTFSGYKTNSNEHGISICFYDSSKNFISRPPLIPSSGNTGTGLQSATFTPPEGSCFYRINIGRSYRDIQIVPGDTVKQYGSEYGFDQYTIEFPSTPGTVYGGTLTVNKDGTGKLVVKVKAKTYSDSTGWNKGTTGSASQPFNITESDMVTAPSTDTEGIIACNYLKIKSGASASSDVWAIRGTTSSPRNRIFIYVPLEISSTDALTTYFTSNPLQVVYKLATPVEYDLTATEVGQILSLLGTNNLFCDTGDVLSVDYSADTKLYVDGKISEGMKLITLLLTANHEDGMKASKAYVSGDLLTVGNTLYKATTSIANGATLTAGTNVTETTIETELAALA